MKDGKHMKKKYMAFIIAGIAAVFFAGGFLAGRFIEKPLYLYARVLEVREDTLNIEVVPQRGIQRAAIVELLLVSPVENTTAKIKDINGKTIHPGELPINSAVRITFDGTFHASESSQAQIRTAFSIRIVDALPETA
jgi:hypothetical protein